ncbi:MAG: AAA family ATPase, partial [Spirochaetota bacterium]
MIFIAGPRQVGKTTSSKAGAGEARYFSWDRQSDRLLITHGQNTVADSLQLSDMMEKPQVVIFDELHKYSKWKSFLKGFFDVYGDKCKILLTGSARLSVYKRGGDSLMGRYFLYRMHPLSVSEIQSQDVREDEIKKPVYIDKETIDQLLNYGGFPE